MHDLGFLKYPETLTPESRRYYARRRVRSGARERTIVVSKSTADDVLEILGVPRARHVVHNGVVPAIQPVEDSEDAPRDHSTLRAGATYILLWGRSSREEPAHAAPRVSSGARAPRR